MHSIYLGIWAFINAAGGSPPLSSEAIACIEFILRLAAPLLSTLQHWKQPPLRGAWEEGKRHRKQKCHVLLGSVVSQLTGSISFVLVPVHEALWPSHLSPALGLPAQRRKDWDLPPRSFSEGHTVSKRWSQDENGPPLLAPRPLHDSELVSEVRRLGKVSFVYVESSAFCFPFKAREPHDDSECMQECACTLILVPGSVMPASD